MAKRTLQYLTPEEMESYFIQEGDTPNAEKRIRALIKRYRAQCDRVSELEAAQATAGDGIEAARQQAREEALAEADATWGARLAEQREELELSRLGYDDPDKIDIVRRLHVRTNDDPEKRPPISEWAKRIREDEKAREGISETMTLALGLGKPKGGSPGVTAGAGDPAPLDEKRVRELFAEGEAGVTKLLSMVPA